MKQYKVQWDYASSLAGPWSKGDVVEMEAEWADVVNRDSPGVLVEAKKSKRAAKPKQDRMARSGQNRSVQHGDAT